MADECQWYDENSQVLWHMPCKVDSYLLERYALEVSDGPFYNSTLGLRFLLKKDWVDTNKYKMDVKCAAKVSGADAKMDETSVRLRAVTDHTLSQERHIYNTGAVFTNYWLVILTIFVLHCYGTQN